MKSYTQILLLIGILLVGCSNSQTELEVQRQKTMYAEENARKAEEESQKANEDKTMWQAVAWSAVIGCVILLVIGTAIGSSARKEAEERDTKNES